MTAFVTTRLSLSAARRAQRLAMLLAVAFALLSPRAFAMAVPMCDPSGASVIAPLPVLPNATGELAAPKSCDDASRGFVDADTSRRDAPSVQSITPVPERLVAAAFSVPRQKGVLMPRPDSSSDAPPSGHGASVYRPPRA
jgi:hypothetical protein